MDLKSPIFETMANTLNARPDKNEWTRQGRCVGVTSTNTPIKRTIANLPSSIYLCLVIPLMLTIYHSTAGMYRVDIDL